MFPSRGRETICKELAMRYGIRASRWVWPMTFLCNGSHKCLKCRGFETSPWDKARCCEGTPYTPFPSTTIPCCRSQRCLRSRPAWQVGTLVRSLAPQQCWPIYSVQQLAKDLVDEQEPSSYCQLLHWDGARLWWWVHDPEVFQLSICWKILQLFD